MKRLALAVSILAISAASAVAADLPARTYTKAPPPIAAPAYDWSGFYVGANGGYATSSKCWYSFGQAANEGCHDPDGGIAGGQVGYNWQFDRFVVGVEGSGDWANLSAGRASLLIPAVTLNSKVSSIYTAAARAGVAWNNWLFYVKGGGAWAKDNYNETFLGQVATVAGETRGGWLAGIGGEVGLTSNLSVGLEYDYAGMGTRTLGFVPAVAPFTGFNEGIQQNIQMITARLNYRFGGPVVAKY